MLVKFYSYNELGYNKFRNTANLFLSPREVKNNKIYIFYNELIVLNCEKQYYLIQMNLFLHVFCISQSDYFWCPKDVFKWNA